jgi:hypothetical protein
LIATESRIGDLLQSTDQFTWYSFIHRGKCMGMKTLRTHATFWARKYQHHHGCMLSSVDTLLEISMLCRIIVQGVVKHEHAYLLHKYWKLLHTYASCQPEQNWGMTWQQGYRDFYSSNMIGKTEKGGDPTPISTGKEEWFEEYSNRSHSYVQWPWTAADMVVTSYHKHPDNFISSHGSWWRSMSYISRNVYGSNVLTFSHKTGSNGRNSKPWSG